MNEPTQSPPLPTTTVRSMAIIAGADRQPRPRHRRAIHAGGTMIWEPCHLMAGFHFVAATIISRDLNGGDCGLSYHAGEAMGAPHESSYGPSLRFSLYKPHS
jgi:hypothetical protein